VGKLDGVKGKLSEQIFGLEGKIFGFEGKVSELDDNFYAHGMLLKDICMTIGDKGQWQKLVH